MRPQVYEEWPDNLAATFESEMGDVDRAFAEADVVIEERIEIQRLFACPLETRGVVAEWDPFSDELTIWTSSQILHIARDLLADVLRIPEHRIRVIVPKMGGGFGCKFHFYPEEAAVAFAARASGRPVRWIEDRLESFLATCHARQETVDAQMALRRDGEITGVKAEILGDMGASLHTVGYGPVWLTAVMMTNAYVIPNARVRARAVLTNKTPLGSYRGWGQPEANFVVERLVDRAAQTLELDPADVRRRNLIPPDRFPYKGLHHVFDSGRYEDCLDLALDTLDYASWRERQRELREQGRHVGIGLSFYVENTALGPSRILNEGGVDQGGYDISRVRIEPSGDVTVYTGLCDMGQGITNALAQVCADNLGVDPGQRDGGHRRHRLMPVHGLRHGREPRRVGRRRIADEGMRDAARAGHPDRRAHARGGPRGHRARGRPGVRPRLSELGGHVRRRRTSGLHPPDRAARGRRPRAGDHGHLRPAADGVAVRRQRGRRRGRR